MAAQLEGENHFWLMSENYSVMLLCLNSGYIKVLYLDVNTTIHTWVKTGKEGS